MQRWDSELGQQVDDPKVDAFLADILEVCRRHNMSLGANRNYVAGPSLKVHLQAYPSVLDDITHSTRDGPWQKQSSSAR